MAVGFESGAAIGHPKSSIIKCPHVCGEKLSRSGHALCVVKNKLCCASAQCPLLAAQGGRNRIELSS